MVFSVFLLRILKANFQIMELKIMKNDHSTKRINSRFCALVSRQSALVSFQVFFLKNHPATVFAIHPRILGQTCCRACNFLEAALQNEAPHDTCLEMLLGVVVRRPLVGQDGRNRDKPTKTSRMRDIFWYSGWVLWMFWSNIPKEYIQTNFLQGHQIIE